MEALKDIAVILGYLAEIAAVIVAVYKIGKKIDKKVERIENHMTENYVDIKRLTFVSKDMPIGERLDAGEKYVNAGGNGEVKVQYNVLKKEYEEQLLNELHSNEDSHK